MLYKICCVLDAAAGAYLQPNFFRATEEAIRAFRLSCNSKDDSNLFTRSPKDYTLVELGIWDDVAGTISLYDQDVVLGNAVEFIDKIVPRSPAEAAPKMPPLVL